MISMVFILLKGEKQLVIFMCVIGFESSIHFSGTFSPVYPGAVGIIKCLHLAKCLSDDSEKNLCLTGTQAVTGH